MNFGDVSERATSNTSEVNRAGFTIIEVLTATTVLLVGFVGLIQALTIGTESLDSARKQHIASQIVEAELEKLRGGDWSRIANLPASSTISIDSAGAITGDTTSFALANYTADPSDDNTALSSLAKDFSCTLTATRLRPTGATATTVTFVRISITVNWTGNTGRAHSRTTEAFLGANGLHLTYLQS